MPAAATNGVNSIIRTRIMRKLILSCTSLFAMAVLLLASPVRAQSVLWVGPNGNDNSACSQTAPCATFQGAINKGSVSQINCVGSGNYGTFTITGSLTVDCGAGNVGNIVSSSAEGITVQTTASATVILRHLALNGLSSNNAVEGIHAIAFFSGTLIVEDCTIHGYHQGDGIQFETTNGRGLLQVSNSQIFDNLDGIVVEPVSGQIASVTLDQVELVGNVQNGLQLAGAGIIAGTMRHSVVGENGTIGVSAFASQVFFTIEESSIVDNLSTGILTDSAGTVVNVGASTIGGNGTGVAASVGSLISFGNNQMSANGTNGNFTSATALR
jgi:hypothetical protein